MTDALANCDKWKQQIVDWQKPILDDLMVYFFNFVLFCFYFFSFVVFGVFFFLFFLNIFFIIISFSCRYGTNMPYLMNFTISLKEVQCGLLGKWMIKKKM